MSEDTVLPFDLPSVCRKKVRVGFDGGQLSSDCGVLLLRGADRKLGLASLLAGCLRDKRDPDLIEHTLEEMLRLRMFAIAAGYEDADDCDRLRHDPVFKMAVGRLPESGDALCSQPTMSRLENAPSKIELARLMVAMVDLFCESYRRQPASIVLDIDDTCDTVHGHQQLSLFNAYYDERCFLPIHIYEAQSGKPVAMILRSGKTPSGVEVRCVLKHVVKRIRRHWPRTHILVRGDSHYGRVEAMAWCEQTPGVDYVLGFAVNEVLKALTHDQAQALARAQSCSGHDKLRRFMTFDYAAKGWDKPRRFVARIEATARGVDVRYVVSSLELDAKPLYETLYCARGGSENFIKWHKSQLASDRTSCRKPEANQFRLILHTAAYWLMLAIRQAAPKRSALAFAEFHTLRLHLIKIAARVVEGLARIRIHLPSACPNAAVLRAIAGRLHRLAREHPGLALGPDGKVIVFLRDDGSAWSLEAFSCSLQQREAADDVALHRAVRLAVEEELARLAQALPGLSARLPDRLTVNGAGAFEVGGPEGDNGLSGKKLVVDAYGPRVQVGGGAWSGKDFFKADRAGALHARRVAKLAIRLGLAREATVTLGWHPGEPSARVLRISTDRGDLENAAALADMVDLSLIRSGERFSRTHDLVEISRWGHFSDPSVPWEKTDLL